MNKVRHYRLRIDLTLVDISSSLECIRVTTLRFTSNGRMAKPKSVMEIRSEI